MIKTIIVGILKDSKRPIVASTTFDGIKNLLAEYYGKDGVFLKFNPYDSKFPDDYWGSLEYEVLFGGTKDIEIIDIFDCDFDIPKDDYSFLISRLGSSEFKIFKEQAIQNALNNLPDDGLFPNYTDSDIYEAGMREGIEWFFNHLKNK